MCNEVEKPRTILDVQLDILRAYRDAQRSRMANLWLADPKLKREKEPNNDRTE